jgi:transposase
MHQDTPLEIKAMSKKEIVQYYGISYHILRKWLAPFKDKIGTVIASTYTPKQVKIIIDCLS